MVRRSGRKGIGARLAATTTDRTTDEARQAGIHRCHLPVSMDAHDRVLQCGRVIGVLCAHPFDLAL